jgi:hypothetical protein
VIHGRRQSWLNLRYYPSICLEGLRKTTKTSARIASLWAKFLTWDLQNEFSSRTQVVQKYNIFKLLQKY